MDDLWRLDAEDGTVAKLVVEDTVILSCIVVHLCQDVCLTILVAETICDKGYDRTTTILAPQVVIEYVATHHWSCIERSKVNLLIIIILYSVSQREA